MSMKPAWPMLSSPVRPKCTLRPIAARAYAAVTGWNSSPTTLARIRVQSICCLPSADALGAPQDALGTHEENEDEDHQGARVAKVRGDDERRHLCHEADDDGSHEGAERRTETTERDGGEHQEQDRPAHVPRGDVEVEPDE